jgi:hypothetical protein
MNITGSILLSLSVVCLIIGIHQLMVNGLMDSYWIFMLCVSLLLLYKMNKSKASDNNKQTTAKAPKKQIKKK